MLAGIVIKNHRILRFTEHHLGQRGKLIPLATLGEERGVIDTHCLIDTRIVIDTQKQVMIPTEVGTGVGGDSVGVSRYGRCQGARMESAGEAQIVANAIVKRTIPTGGVGRTVGYCGGSGGGGGGCRDGVYGERLGGRENEGGCGGVVSHRHARNVYATESRRQESHHLVGCIVTIGDCDGGRCGG